MAALLSIPNAILNFGEALFFFRVSINLLLWVCVYLLLSRFGLLSVCAAFFFIITWQIVPDLSFSSWYAGNSIVVLVTLAAVIGYAFYISLGGRSLFAESMVPGD
jgi:hypothetical protein